MTSLARKCRAVRDAHKDGLVSTEETRRRLEYLERKAYEDDPEAEPDGEITLLVAETLDAVLANVSSSGPSAP